MHTFQSTTLSDFHKSKSRKYSKMTCMEVYCRLKVLLKLSVHICLSTQNELGKSSMSLLKRVSFALNEWMASLLFTSGNASKQHRSKYTKKENTNMESKYDVLAYLVPSFRTFVTHVPASPTSKQSTSIDNELKVQEINLSGSPCAPETNPPVVRPLRCL